MAFLLAFLQQLRQLPRQVPSSTGGIPCCLYRQWGPTESIPVPESAEKSEDTTLCYLGLLPYIVILLLVYVTVISNKVFCLFSKRLFHRGMIDLFNSAKSIWSIQKKNKLIINNSAYISYSIFFFNSFSDLISF